MHFKEYAHASLIFKGIATEPDIAGAFGQVGPGFLILRGVPPGLIVLALISLCLYISMAL